jgi:hypothetical protein
MDASKFRTFYELASPSKVDIHRAAQTATFPSIVKFLLPPVDIPFIISVAIEDSPEEKLDVILEYLEFDSPGELFVLKIRAACDDNQLRKYLETFARKRVAEAKEILEKGIFLPKNTHCNDAKDWSNG